MRSICIEAIAFLLLTSLAYIPWTIGMENENLRYLINQEQAYKCDNTQRNIQIPHALYLAMAITAAQDKEREKSVFTELLQKVSKKGSIITRSEYNGGLVIRLTKKEFFAGLLAHIKSATPLCEEVFAEHTVLLNGKNALMRIGPKFWEPTTISCPSYTNYGCQQELEQLVEQYKKIPFQ